MTEKVEETTGPLPGECAVCGAEDDESGASVVWEIITEEEEQIPSEDWYLHVHSVETVEGQMLRGIDAYLFCPDCAPEEALPTAEENPDLDMEEFVERWTEELGNDNR